MTKVDRRRIARPGVVLVSEPDDEHGDYLQSLFERAFTRVVRVSFATAMAEPYSWRPGGGQGAWPMLGRGQWVGLWRRAGEPDTRAIHEQYRTFARSEWYDAFEGAFDSSPVRWLSTLRSMRRAELKLAQLNMANSIRIPYPKTLVTNDPSAAAEFAAGQRTIAKPVRYGLVSVNPTLMAWTREVQASDLGSSDGPPVIFQQHLSANYHLRVVTVGDTAFPTKLEASELDWRSRTENHDEFVATTVGRDLAIGANAVRLARAFELGFSAQDWIVDNKGKGYFLDLNPNGQWLFVERAWSGAIGRAIVDELLSVGLAA